MDGRRLPAVAAASQVTDWQTISSLGTAGGTLVLAVATFVALRSSNRSARIAEDGFLAGMRPLLVHSLDEDPVHRVMWRDLRMADLAGGQAVFEEEDDVIYLAAGLRNVGAGIALLHGWQLIPDPAPVIDQHADAAEFHRVSVDLYITSGGSGYWSGAVRDTDDPDRAALMSTLVERGPLAIDVLYGDQQGRQRTISRFVIVPNTADGWHCRAVRHWNLDHPKPR